MTLEIVLFALRLLSALLLASMLIALFVVVWRDYASAATHTEISRRSYGQLSALQEIDGIYAPTGDTYPLRPLTSLGRSPTNSIVISDGFASSEHALISLRDGRWWLEDRNSRNGTLLNQERITAPVIITDGDIISIGTSHFRLLIDV